MNIKNNIVTKFRTNSFEKKIIINRAKKAGLSQSEFCKRAVLKMEIKERLTTQQIDLYRMLVKYHNNFKVISNLLKNKDSEIYKKIIQTADEVKSHLQNFK